MAFSEDKIIFQAGRKTFDIISSQDEGRFQFQVVERYKGRTHKTVMSFRELLWVCEWMKKATESGGFFGRKGRTNGEKS